MKNTNNWKPREHVGVRTNSGYRKYIYAVYQDDVLVFQGTIHEVASFVNRWETTMLRYAKKWDRFEIIDKGRIYVIVYLGEEYAEEMTCVICGKTKPVSEFRIRTGGLHDLVCKKCYSQRSSEYHYRYAQNVKKGRTK